MTLLRGDYTPLTEREQEILSRMVDGLTNQEIADRLFLSLKTVKWYNTQIFEKLGVTNRHEAVEQARLLGLGQSQAEPYRVDLPAEATPFIGREQELYDIGRLLGNPANRLITVLGFGGMGKTRLAMAAAQRCGAVFPHGVYYVPLAALHDPGQVSAAIAERLQMPREENATGTLASIINHLRGRSPLLVLDNFEHLMDGAPMLAELLGAAPGLRLLVTSRERLNLHGEVVYALSGLTVPDADSHDPMESDSARLFMQSARRVRPDFALATNDVPHVVNLCRAVEGMPLAVELAAGWVDTLSLAEIDDLTRRNADLLQTELRDVPERQRSIRATFDYSWQMLHMDEQRAFMSLSVFRGGFTREAAQTVAEADALKLRRLVNRAMLGLHPSGRYTIHELLRQYGGDALDHAGFTEEARFRHARYFANLLADKLPYLRRYDAEAANAAKLLEVEFDNLVTAWLWMVEHHDWEGITQAAMGLWRFCGTYGRLYEGIDLLDRALLALRPVSTDETKPLVGHLTARLADLYLSIDPAHGRTLLDDAMRILQEVDAPEYLIAASKLFAYADGVDPVRSEEVLAHAVELAHERLNEFELGKMVHLVSIHRLEQHRFEEARTFAQEALAIAQHTHDSATIFQSRLILGLTSRALGDLDDAYRNFEEIVPTAESGGNMYPISVIRIGMCKICLAREDLLSAKAHMAAMLRFHLHHARTWQKLGATYSATKHLLIPIGENERAVSVLSCLVQHAYTAENVRTESAELLESLRAQMSPEAYRAASDHIPPFECLFEDLIAELEPEAAVE